ncbi:glycosyltransferase family 4 protein [Mariniradius sediminis]|uniref:Glycosyltransferase family 4 protein n=1 Tax=Mariniradius sediminis TaxID=2909237 RepID=A0ABS9BY74_9BACT|nr:glycosyltransferase family 4 protein [Mariniradius sediminis]MCF1752707.1 glycosyltransferase family 4 protein [Mariniradius sediminis]
MKIFFIIKGLNYSGGTERVTAIFSKALIDRGHQVQIVSIVGKGENPFFTFDKKVIRHYLEGPKSSGLPIVRDIRRVRLMKDLFAKEKPDIIIIVDAGRSFVNIPATRGFTTITWEHFNVNTNWHLMHSLSRKIAVKHSDMIVTLTQGDVEAYQKKFGAKKVISIPNPITVDVSEKTPMKENRVLAVGRIVDQKGFDLLVKAWHIAHPKAPDWKLRIVGAGKLQKDLEKLIQSLGVSESVEILPPTKDVVSQYKQASIFALSSRHEGLPLVLIEAMAMGLPAVSFDCETGPRDIVIDGETGILVPPQDIDKMAAGLVDLMTNAEKRKEFSQKAIEASAKFGIEAIVDQWEALFKQLKS